MFSGEIIYLISDSRFSPAIVLVPLFVTSFSLSGAIIFFPGFGIARKTNLIAIITVCTCIINIGFNILLIQEYGVIGSIYASLLSNLFLLTSHMLFSKKYFTTEYDVKTIKAGLLLIGSLCLAYLISETSYTSSIKIFLNLLVLITFSSVLLLIQFTMDEIKKTYRKVF
jgi:O-antigen/teichoic acid export membrane protein